MAGAAFKGDTSRLVKLSERIRRLAGDSFMRTMNESLALTAHELVMAGFFLGRDPYGKAWKKPRGRAGGLPLQDTRRLMNSITATATSTGFRIGSPLVYAAIHNYGGVIKAKRAKYLKFRVGGKRGGKTQRRGGKLGKGEHWVMVKEVTIPKRQYLPTEGRLGLQWRRRFTSQAVRLRRLYLGQ